jgi:biotin carboxylase
MASNVFVLGLDDENRRVLERLPQPADCTFHQLFTIEELQHGDAIPVLELLDEGERRLRAFDGTVDAIVGYWDFPVTLMVPILADRLGLPGPSLQSRLMCEHKYWSRLVQREVVPEACVDFALLDPFADDPRAGIDLEYPFWVKPVKAMSSMLALQVEDDASLDQALAVLRADVGRIGDPFGDLLAMVDTPPEIGELGGSACIAEEQATGIQTTLEGYAQGDAVEVYGIVHSVHYPETSSFYAYRYPADLPEEVCRRMADLARRVVSALDLAPSTFNIEFFWDERHDRITILEINPRHSQSHAHLFELVDGRANHQAMLDLALGRTPSLPRGEGPFAVAAKWYIRRFADGRVRAVPTAAELAAIAEAMSGVSVHLEVREGDRLSELRDQDAYSYKLAHAYIGAHDADELVRKYEQCVARLHFEIE